MMPVDKLTPFVPPQEAEDTLHAIIVGEVDALVVEGPDGPRVYTLRNAGEPYRMLVERMSDAAVVLNATGTILYCNGRLAELIGGGTDEAMGRDFGNLVAPAHRSRFTTLLASGLNIAAAAEIHLRRADGGTLPARLSAVPMAFDEQPCAAMVISDLSLQQRSERLVAASEFAATILDQATQPIIVCDLDGIVTHASSNAAELCGGTPVGRRFQDAFAFHTACVREQALTAPPGTACEATLLHQGKPHHFLVKGASLFDLRGDLVGCVLSLTDITALKAAKLQAEHANAAKSRFLASASHDLRQPFQAMRLFLDILMAMDLDPKAQSALRGLHGAVTAGSELLTALLDVSSFEAGTIQPTVGELDLQEILSEVVAEHVSVAAEQGLRLDLHCVPLTVRSDRVLLKRMVRNLVQNALRYTERGGILIAGRRRGTAVVVQVWDTGCGIAEEQLPSIFEDFYQVGNSARDRSKGLGLGLSIVQRMGRLLDHPVQVTSRLGRGSVFSVTVPAAPG